MRRHLLLVPAFACLLASPVPAADIAEDAPSTPTAVTAPSQVAPVAPTEAELEAARVERLQRIELNNRMNAVLEVSLKTLAGLQAVINATTDPATLRDLELRMAQVKRGTTLDLLRVQATFARENGRIAQADRIDAEIAEILSPKRTVPAGAAASAARRQAVAPTGGAR